ncbi:MAG: sigma-70 family RNA polymerase sigma factor [Clostridia bacterium]|nr:sigma-70 family RNA polymerase sigma factor [Clostridia bacterium]
MTDNEIITLYFKRDPEAIFYTSRKYGRLCYSISLNILGSEEDSKECVNDTYIKTWNSIPPHKPDVLSAFLAKITRALSISRLRMLRAQKRDVKAAVSFDELNDCIAEKGRVYENIEAEELKNIIESFLKNQNDNERNIFICRYFYGDSISDICKRFHFSQSKVKTTLYRTRKKLREHLVKEGVFDE